MAGYLRRVLRVLYPDRIAARKPKRNSAQFSWKRFALVVLAVFVFIKVWLLLFYYNDFISLQYDVEEAAAQIDAQLQRRKNIILNLSIMVMDYAEHEKAVFKHAAETRREMAGPRVVTKPSEAPAGNRKGKQAQGAVGDLEALLSRIFAVAERYPGLRLSENFQSYMDALVDAETRIAKERMTYNERANDMSTALGRFPGFLFARLYGFEAPRFFEPEEEARRPPRVKY